MNYSVCSLSSHHVCSLFISYPQVAKIPCFVSSHTLGGAVTFSHCRLRRKLSLFISPSYWWLHYLRRLTVSVIDYVKVSSILLLILQFIGKHLNVA